MKRRNFLAGASALALSPLMIQKAFADGAEALRSEALFEAYRRARRAGRPLLVIIVPSKDGWERGSAWGEYLNHGTEAQLAPLAIFEPACATADELAKLAPQAEVSSDAVLVALDTLKIPAATHTVETKLETSSRGLRRKLYRGNLDRAAYIAAVDAQIDRNIEQLAEAADRARVAVRPTNPDQETALWKPKDGIAYDADEPSIEEVAASAGWYIERIRAGWGDPKGAIKAALADVVRARFRDERIPGSHWARSYGCGTQVEGGEAAMVACGMGHVNARSVRFLHFYVEREQQAE